MIWRLGSAVTAVLAVFLGLGYRLTNSTPAFVSIDTDVWRYTAYRALGTSLLRRDATNVFLLAHQHSWVLVNAGLSNSQGQPHAEDLAAAVQKQVPSGEQLSAVLGASAVKQA